MKNSSALFWVIGFITCLNSCVHETDLSSLKTISFTGDIQPILAGNCTMSGCHSNDSQSEFSLLTYDDVISNGEVKAGNAHDSELYEAITETEGDDAMPPAPLSRLSDDQLTKIYIWIEQGAKNN